MILYDKSYNKHQLKICQKEIEPSSGHQADVGTLEFQVIAVNLSKSLDLGGFTDMTESEDSIRLNWSFDSVKMIKSNDLAKLTEYLGVFSLLSALLGPLEVIAKCYQEKIGVACPAGTISLGWRWLLALRDG